MTIGGGGAFDVSPPLIFWEVQIMAHVTKEQIAKAKEWDLLTYLQTFEPGELKKSGPHEYCTRTHDSLKISNGKWFWNSRRIGGRTALDYLIKVREMGFTEAVEALCGYRAPPPSERPKPKPKKPFALPPARLCPSAVVSYLQGRGIDSEIIRLCVERGDLYESRKYRNCVFVGRDPSGHARFAALCGTRDRFRLEVESSDKRYSFCLPAADPDCPRLAVAESPIDALSLATLMKRSGQDWRSFHCLSLGGTGPRAMLQFLYDHPNVTKISLCLDNDKAGLEGIERLVQAIRDDPELSARMKVVYRNPPPAAFGKDYNEMLCAQLQAARAQEQRAPAEAR